MFRLGVDGVLALTTRAYPDITCAMSLKYSLLRCVTRLVALKRKRASVVCVDDGQLLCVRLRDPLTGVARLFVPGGQIEKGETPAEAAVREVLEETGYRVGLKSDAAVVERYPFCWAGVRIDCTTHFHRAELMGHRSAQQPRDPNEPDYNETCVWIPLCRVNAELAFQPQMQEAVMSLLRE